MQYEQPVKITETNEPQGVNKSFVQVSLLKWLLPSSKFYSSVIIYIENLFSPINCVKKVPQCQRSNITGGGPTVSLTYSVSNFDPIVFCNLFLWRLGMNRYGWVTPPLPRKDGHQSRESWQAGSAPVIKGILFIKSYLR